MKLNIFKPPSCIPDQIVAATDVSSKAWFQMLLWLFAVAHIVIARFVSVLVLVHVISTKSSQKRGMLLKQ